MDLLIQMIIHLNILRDLCWKFPTKKSQEICELFYANLNTSGWKPLTICIPIQWYQNSQPNNSLSYCKLVNEVCTKAELKAFSSHLYSTVPYWKKLLPLVLTNHVSHHMKEELATKLESFVPNLAVNFMILDLESLQFLMFLAILNSVFLPL